MTDAVSDLPGAPPPPCWLPLPLAVIGRCGADTRAEHLSLAVSRVAAPSGFVGAISLSMLFGGRPARVFATAAGGEGWVRLRSWALPAQACAARAPDHRRLARVPHPNKQQEDFATNECNFL